MLSLTLRISSDLQEDDTLTGNDEDNIIEGGDGDDVLNPGTMVVAIPFPIEVRTGLSMLI